MAILSYTFEEFAARVRSFHGFEALGVILGGFMVDLAYRHIEKGRLFDAICETKKCLPDAVQLLTPCTLGNGWLKVVNIGRFALTLYDKETGVGVRVFVDTERISAWPELSAWFFKTKTKKEQDLDRLFQEARTAGANICGVQSVRVVEKLRKKEKKGQYAICPVCGESYPFDGPACMACMGETVYEEIGEKQPTEP